MNDQSSLMPLPTPHFKKKSSIATLLSLPISACLLVFSGAAVAQINEDAKKNKDSNHSIGFDLELLKQRGLDPSLAEYFREAPRFTQGVHTVMLLVNGVKRGLISAQFDGLGQLCFDRALLEKAGLPIPDKSLLLPGQALNAANVIGAPSGCYNLKAVVAQTEVELHPGRAEVSLVVPSSALQVVETDFSEYATGGTAALFNYSVMSMTNRTPSQSTQFYSANTELGFNSHDWLVRSRQTYSKQENSSNFQSLNTYAQRTFADYKATLQIGQINITNSVVSGAAISGFQIVPESALLAAPKGGATIEGIAHSQARIEVHQVGALIYSTIVPAGPFVLINIKPINGSADLVVSVIESNGSNQQFTVPAISFGQIMATAPGYSFALGQLRRFGVESNSNDNNPMVLTMSGGWLLDDRSLLSAGWLAAEKYQSLGWGVNTYFGKNTSFNIRNVISSATTESKQGAQLNLSASVLLSEKFSMGLAASKQTSGYRDLMDTVYHSPDNVINRKRDQYSASIRWNDNFWGAMGMTYTDSTDYTGYAQKRVSASWGRSFNKVSVSANLERNISSNNSANFGNQRNDNSFYLNIGVPLGKSSLRAYSNTYGGKTRYGSTFSDQVNDMMNYRLSAEARSDNQQDVSANINLLPRYAQVSLGVSHSSESDNSTFTGEIRGGLVVHHSGLKLAATLSPYEIQDTFGVVHVGDVAGVRIDTPGGPVWTDSGGNAVVPNLAAYRQNRLEIETKSLPRNVDIKNGYKTVDAGRGSVHHIDFDVIKVRRVLMAITDTKGVALPKGASVVDGNGQFLTSVVDQGKVFLVQGQLNEGIKINLPDESQCSLDYSLPEKADLDVYFENVNAVCR